MEWSEEPSSLRALCQRWSLPLLAHTEDLETAIAAATRSCPFSSGGVEVCSHIFLVTQSASTVPGPPAWPQATGRYRRHLTLTWEEGGVE